MDRPPRVLGIIQAGGSGSRMDVLTRERAKPALAFAGTYQLIDFAVSCLVNSGITDVWVAVDYLAATLDEHLAHGRPWDIDRARGGYRRLVPQQGRSTVESGFAAGNADDLLHHAPQIRAFSPDVLVVMSADHVFRLDLRPVISEHLRLRSECTVVTAQVSEDDAREKAVVISDDDEDGVVTTFAYKSDEPPSTTAVTEVFVYDPKVLLELLEELRAELAADPHHHDTIREGSSGLGDFGEHLLPALVARGRTRATPIPHYWRDLGRPAAYLTAHRDVVRGEVDVFSDPAQPVVTRWPDLLPPVVRASGHVTNSLLSPGVEVRGSVAGSVLGPGSVIEEGAEVVDSVLGERVVVERGAHVATSVLDDGTHVGRDARVGEEGPRENLEDEHVTLVGRDSVVSSRTTIPAGARLEPGSTA